LNLQNQKIRKIILHYHIFKNAGTTIEWILKKNYSNNAISIEDKKNIETIISNNFLLDLLKKNQNYKAISSHQIRFPLPQSPEFIFLPIIFIRHPIDRILSVFEFKKRTNDPFLPTNLKTNVKEFAKWAIEKHYMVTENYQVNFLSYPTSKRFGLDLPKAIDDVKNCFIVGIVDRMDESLVLAEESLKSHFDNIDLSYIKQNVSPGREQTLKKRLDTTKSIIGEQLFKQAEENNSEDFQLYNASNAELDKRLKTIDNLKKKLIDFQTRCKKNKLSDFKIKFSKIKNKTIKIKQFEIT